MFNNGRRLTSLVLLVALSLSGQAQDGEALFKANCMACHTTTTQRMVGPGMKGVTLKRSKEWLHAWIKNSPELIASGDADAIAIFEEYNKIPMTPFTNLKDGEIDAIITYMESIDAVPVTETAVSETATPKVEYTAADVEAGKQLYTGSTRFANGGASCLTCHNVDNADIVAGGLLAKDLTNAYSRMGGDAGLNGILGAPPFPAMATAYNNNKLTEEEIKQLSAFLKSVDVESPMQASGKGVLWQFGFIGLFIWLVVVYLLWSGRKKLSVKDSIFKRQVKPIN